MKDFLLPCSPFALYGVFYDESKGRFLRMDEDRATTVSDGVAHLCKNTAGGRLRFATDAKRIELSARYDFFGIMPHMAALGSSGFTLCREVDGKEELVAAFMPTHKDERAFFGGAELNGERTEYILYFPLYNDVTKLELSFNEEARVEEGKGYRAEKPILYYGSSITQGGCASRPDTSYEAMICKWNRIDFINLGFSGNARGEREIAEYLAAIECSLFVCDYDHNAPSARELEATHYAFYKAYRAAQKEAPILFVTKPDARRDPEGEARKAIVYATYQRGRAEGDDKVFFLDGRAFYEDEDAELCAVDGCHPTDLGFFKIAKKLYAKMQEIDGKFA